ncbi:MAG: histidine phosphotransferase family protein [Pseudomonadota bacterium]
MREIGAAGLDDEMAMIGQSASRASGLLQFYRLAFGAAPDDAQPIGRAILRDHAESVINWQRISLSWDQDDGPPLSRAEAKLLSLLLLCARGVTGMSGVIEVGLERDATFPLHITVASAGTPETDERLAILSGEEATPDPNARQVEYVLAHGTAQAIDIRLHTARAADRITLMAANVANL